MWGHGVVGSTVFAVSAESGWQHIFRRASGVGWAAQFLQGCAGSPGSGCKHSFRRASGVRLPAQFEQGERGGVGSKSVIYWLRIIAFADILCSQLDKSFRAGTDLAGASSQGKRGWLGNTVFAKPAGWGWHHSCRRASGVGAAAHFSQGQRGVIGSTYFARSVGWCWQHSFRRASGA